MTELGRMANATLNRLSIAAQDEIWTRVLVEAIAAESWQGDGDQGGGQGIAKDFGVPLGEQVVGATVE